MSRPSPFNQNNKPIPAARAFLPDENVNTSVNADVNENVSTNIDTNTNVNVYKKKVKFEDTHTRQTYYIANDLIKDLNELADNERGIKTKFINDAIREHIKKVKKQLAKPS